MDGKVLVSLVREAALKHNITWAELVPDEFTINLAAEAAEEHAYAEMAIAKAALRDHICDTYGISIRELASLAMP
jgi:chromosomal replication initiation ATPase DnaA